MEAVKTAPKKVINGWAMYDWANSVYNLVITTTFFPIYFTEMTKGEPYNGEVTIWGRTFVNTALYNYALAVTYLLVAITLPILSSMADYRGKKKTFMRIFVTIGSLACCAMYFFTKSNIYIGVACMMVAAFGFYSSLVYYNAYLPEIAAPADRDRVSAKGFSYGYIGSVIMQLIGFVIVTFWEKIPFIQNETHAVRITFFLVGLWWIGFAQIPFARLPNGEPSAKDPGRNILTGVFTELRNVFKKFMKMPVMKYFLPAFFFYNTGVQTVMLAATIFGSKVLNLDSTKLIVTVVAIQLVAIPGALFISKLSARFGNFKVLLGLIIIWFAVCIGGYFIQSEWQFYILAVTVGLVMGGIQSLSRSTYSKLMPQTKDTASFFSFYDVTEKLAIVMGLFSFAYIEELTGSMRYSVLALMLFFVIGFIFLFLAQKASKRSENAGIESHHN